jgi:MATE family multidrug resistance protein
VGLSSAALLSLDQWNLEFLSVYASFISLDSASAMAIIVNVLMILIMASYGYMLTANIFVGKAIGEGNGNKAIRYAKILALFTFIQAAIVAILLVIFRSKVASTFTDIASVASIVEENLQWVALLAVVHCMAIVLGGIMRGLGKSTSATLFVFIAFYMIGQPCGAIYTFVLGFDIAGLIFGFLTGSCSLGLLVYMNLTCFSDWNQIALEIRSTMLKDRRSQVPLQDDEDFENEGSNAFDE